jgi:uncharacterized membrane protein
MHTALWVIAGVLAAGMLLAGAMKLAQSKAELQRRGIDLPDRFSDTGVKALGLAEVLGAAGLILPGIAHRGTVLVPVAALCIAILLSCGVIFHLRRHDGFGRTLPTILLLVLSVTVVWGRFGPYALYVP